MIRLENCWTSPCQALMSLSRPPLPASGRRRTIPASASPAVTDRAPYGPRTVVRCAGTSRRRRRCTIVARARIRTALRSVVLVGVGVAIGFCGLGHPDPAVGRRAEQNPGRGIARIQEPGGNRGRHAATAADPGSGQEIPSNVVVVHAGDTVWELSERYGPPDAPIGETVENIVSWNQLGPGARLHPGQMVRVQP